MRLDQEAESIRRELDKEKRTTVSVALFGQPGAGKSSLINMIVGQDVAEVGVETDKTKEAKSYEHNGLRFVDLPGYGTVGFPKETYFKKFDIPSFDLFLCVTSGKLHQADTEFFQELSKRGKVCIFVANKHDELWQKNVTIEELERSKIADIEMHVGRTVVIVFTSCRKSTGLDRLIDAIEGSLEGAKRERWQRGAKAYSEKFLASKKSACEKYVAVSAGASAANALNPIPGIDVSVDIGILIQLFREIRDCYGLGDDALDALKHSAIPAVGRMANTVISYGTKEGLMMLLKSFLGREAAKSLAKWVPLVGQAIAAGIGYAIVSNAGATYLNSCHELAAERLRNHLEA